MVLYRLGDGVLRHLQVNKNNMVQICLNKSNLEGSIRQHYLDLGVLSIRSLYRKIVIMFIFKCLINKTVTLFMKTKEKIESITFL